MSHHALSHDRQGERRALLGGAMVYAVTAIHHVYGAFRYHTPWRAHAALVAGLALLVMIGALAVSRARPASATGRAAWWTFFVVNAVVFVLFLGVFEGAYNHVLKNVLYLAGLSPSHMRALFPPPMYEMPNDWFFEITGVLHVIPAALTARYLARLLPRARVSGRAHA